MNRAQEKRDRPRTKRSMSGSTLRVNRKLGLAPRQRRFMQ